MNYDDTKSELRGYCQDIAYTINALFNGKFYDADTGELVDEIPEDNESDERYQDLEDYIIDDNFGIKIVTSLDSKDLYGVEICVAWGGPNIYINTRTARVEGYWGGTETEYPILCDACDRINDYIDELRGCY